MNHQQRNPPPPPPIFRLAATPTGRILERTTSLFYSHLLTFLLLSTFVFTFRSNVLSASRYLSSRIDRDSSLKSILYHAGIIGSDSGNPIPNATLVHLNYGSSSGISFPSIVKPGAFGFNPEFAEISIDDGKGLGLSGRDDAAATSLFFLAGVLSSYACLLVAFTVTYSGANGVVFLRVTDHLLGIRRLFLGTFGDGLNIGLKGLAGFIAVKCLVRFTIAQLLVICYFSEIKDEYVVFNVFLKMIFMPFADMEPWGALVRGHERESSGFLVVWFFCDFVVGLIFSVGSWVAFEDPKRGDWEIIKDGCRLVLPLFCPAFEIRLLEAVACGALGRWMLKRVLGLVYVMVFQSLMEVYFMVAWLVLYFAARQKRDAALGRTFSRRELEGLLDIAW